MSDEDFKSENIFPQIKAVQKTGIKGKTLFMPIRIAVFGRNARTRITRYHLSAWT